MKYHLIILCLASVLVSCESKKEEEQQPKASAEISLSPEQLKNIAIDSARTVAADDELILTGKVTFDESKVGKVYPLVGGNVTGVNVALGDKVMKGQLLATIRSTDISDLQNQYQVAMNSQALAKKNLDIAQELFDTHVNSETQLLSARNEYSRSQAETNRLQQALAVYGANTTNADGLYKVFSPRDGFVVEKNVNEEMEIRSDNSENLFTVSSLNTVWVMADVYESDLAKVNVGDAVDITTLAYGDRIFSGKISQIGNILDPETKTMKVRIELDNPDGLLKPEMFAVVKVKITGNFTAVAVPSSAVIFDNNRFFVMVRRSAGDFEKRLVVPGTSGQGKTIIKDGLKAGEVVVTEGSLLAANNKM